MVSGKSGKVTGKYFLLIPTNNYIRNNDVRKKFDYILKSGHQS